MSNRSFPPALALALVVAPLMSVNAQDAAPTAPERGWYLDATFLQAPASEPPRGEVIRVATAEELYEAAAQVREGGTVLLAPGRYVLGRRVEISRDRVSLRGESRDREAVVLDGRGTLSEGISVSSCSGASISDLCIENIRWNGIKINSETGVHGLTIRNCVLRNVWQRGVKGTTLPIENREALRPSGRIEGCLFENLRPKSFQDDASDNAGNFGGNYIGGIDLMFAQNWSIRANVFRGLRGRTGEARGAVFLWHQSRDCTIEGNVIMDCDAGICLGNSFRGPVDVHAVRIVVRNNFVSRAEQAGIFAAYTQGCSIVHNTIFEPASRLKRLIRVAHENTGLLVANNLLFGPPPLNESPDEIEFRFNIADASPELLLAPEHGDLRLRPGAAAARAEAGREPLVRQDITGRERGARPTVGAFEQRD